MAEKNAQVVELDDSSNSSSPEKTVTTSPVRSLQNREQMKSLEQEEDCFILEFDPSEELQLSKASLSDEEAELIVVAEKGQVVACRDYPHPRHTCIQFPFEKTPHSSYCEQCYCYVCDIVAPCLKWLGSDRHCEAFDNEGWREEKKAMRAKEIHSIDD